MRDFIRNYLGCYPKFILHIFIFTYDCIKNEILLETIKNMISNLHYEIIFLSMTGSGMRFYRELLKYIIPNLYYEIIFLSTIGSRMRFY